MPAVKLVVRRGIHTPLLAVWFTKTVLVPAAWTMSTGTLGARLASAVQRSETVKSPLDGSVGMKRTVWAPLLVLPSWR